MSSLLIDSPAPAASATRTGRALQLLVLVLAIGVAAVCGWRRREIVSAAIAAIFVWLGFWLGRLLGGVRLGLVVVVIVGAAMAAEVKLAWEAAALLALIGTVASLRWRDDPAPALGLVAMGSWAAFAWLLWPRG